MGPAEGTIGKIEAHSLYVNKAWRCFTGNYSRFASLCLCLYARLSLSDWQENHRHDSAHRASQLLDITSIRKWTHALKCVNREYWRSKVYGTPLQPEALCLSGSGPEVKSPTTFPTGKWNLLSVTTPLSSLPPLISLPSLRAWDEGEQEVHSLFWVISELALHTTRPHHSSKQSADVSVNSSSGLSSSSILLLHLVSQYYRGLVYESGSQSV